MNNILYIIYMGLFIAEGDYGPDQDSEFNEIFLPFKKGDLIFLKIKTMAVGQKVLI